MIVLSSDSGWDVIFQPAHGLLAGSLARHLKPELQPSYWYETLIAIATHDDSKVAFRSEDRTYLTDAGAPQNFDQVSMTSQQRFHEVCNRLKNAYRKHRWLGLLESAHADFLYQSADVSDELQQLLNDEKKRRRRTLKELSETSEHLDAAYSVLRWCDRLSLILCRARLPEMERRLEVGELPDGETYQIMTRSDDSVGIDPWPFEANQFDVAVEVHQLRQLAFEDDRELKQALKESRTTTRVWSFRKS